MITVWVLQKNGDAQCRTFDSVGTEELELLAVPDERELLLEHALEPACRYLETVRDMAVGVILSGKKVKANEKKTIEEELVDLNRGTSVLKLPVNLQGTILQMDTVREDWTHSDKAETVSVQKYAAGLDELDLCRILCRKDNVGRLKATYTEGMTAGKQFQTEWLDADWYLKTARRYRDFLKSDGEEHGHASILAQAQVIARLKALFAENRGNKNKAALEGETLQEFLSLCRECLQMIDDTWITPSKFVSKGRRMAPMVWSALMKIKYQDSADWVFNAEQELCPPVTLELMEYEQGVWRMDASVDQFAPDQLLLQVRKNGKTAEIQHTKRVVNNFFFGEPIAKRDTFFLELPIAELDRDNTIEFVLTDGVRSVTLPIITADYEARLTRKLDYSYWCFDRYMVTFRREKLGKEEASDSEKERIVTWREETQNTALRLRRTGRAGRLKRELQLLKEILLAPYGSKRMFLIRVLYWLTYPLYERKNIWLTFDKLYKGGDCGEYFYKYMMTRLETGITPEYVIQSSAPDYARLTAEGYQPLVYRSLKQRLMYLHASIIFATHSSVHAFCGFSKWEVRFIQDRLRAVNTCIQHGLSVQDLTADSNRIINNNKRYYCASKYEVENLSKAGYDYPEEVLRLTGVPRYDGLVNHDKKQILITPTWRAYIAMPPVMGQARPYNPEFRNTDYFKIFQELLGNEKLKKKAEQTGYRLIYLLHPVISAQKEDFQVDGHVKLCSAVESDYEQLLTESSLMVTDYSGVQFDFAYMRKPIVYFHPPKLPPHYAEGGFTYETQGFGEICTEIEELVDGLCGYMESGCRLKEQYRKRADDFFAFDDHENCRRIFEDALAYQKEAIRK